MSRLLIIEDNNKFRKTLCSLLVDLSFEIIDFGSGEEGVEYSRDNDFDILLVDLVLPGMNGFDLIKKLKKEKKGLKTILMSAYLTEGIRDKAKEYLVVEILEKPFEIDELIRIINQLMPTETLV